MGLVYFMVEQSMSLKKSFVIKGHQLRAAYKVNFKIP